MDAAPRNPVPPSDLLGAVRRRLPLVLLGVALGLGLASAYVLVQPPAYSSTASVLVTPTGVGDAASPENGQSGRAAVNLATEAELVRSSTVATLARTRLKSNAPAGDLVDAVHVQVPQNTAVLAISYSAPSAGAAQRGAQAFVGAYLDGRRAAAAAALADQVKRVQLQIGTVRAQLRDVTTKISATDSGSPERTFASAESQVLTSQLSRLADTLNTLASTTITPGRIIGDAALPTGPDGPGPRTLLPAGALGGLLLGLALAFLRDRTDPRVHGGADAERRVGVPVLLDLTGTRRRDLALVEPSDARVGREFRRLRNTLTVGLPAERHVLLVTSPHQGRACGVVAGNLAATLARGGSTVTLLCADPRSTTAEELLGEAATGPGLTEALAGELSTAETPRPVPGLAGVQLVAAGTAPELLSERLQSASAAAVLETLRAGADFVVVEAPPTASSADAQTLARWADAALVVAESRRTPAAALADAAFQFEQVGLAELACVVMPQQRPGTSR